MKSMEFNEILEYLKQGHIVRRLTWPDDQFLFMQIPAEIPTINHERLRATLLIFLKIPSRKYDREDNLSAGCFRGSIAIKAGRSRIV